METHKMVAQLIFKYLSNSLDDQEWLMLQEWLAYSERNRKLFSRLTSESYWDETTEVDIEAQPGKVTQLNIATPVRKVHKSLKAACIIILLVVGGTWFYIKKNTVVQVIDSPTSGSQNNSAKGPYLALAMGSIIELNKTVAGPVARINGQEVRNRYMQVRFDSLPVDNLFEYKRQCNSGFFLNSYNSVITPKGSKYVIVLADGSEITLNESSILKLPSQCNGDQRSVELSGEAYFSVKHYYDEVSRQNAPFFVTVNQMKIQVLGTEFNVKTYYGSDSIKTTLVKGSVKLTTDYEKCDLKPGEEAVLTKSGSFSRRKAINVDEVKAWKMSVRFENAPIEEIMEHIKRNFDVTIIYTARKNIFLNVDLPPINSLDKVLDYIKMSGEVKFRREGKKVFVIPTKRH